jgi:predicted signal transduction protein with EAL and GGDEF domain
MWGSFIFYARKIFVILISVYVLWIIAKYERSLELILLRGVCKIYKQLWAHRLQNVWVDNNRFNFLSKRYLNNKCQEFLSLDITLQSNINENLSKLTIDLNDLKLLNESLKATFESGSKRLPQILTSKTERSLTDLNIKPKNPLKIKLILWIVVRSSFTESVLNKNHLDEWMHFVDG